MMATPRRQRRSARPARLPLASLAAALALALAAALALALAIGTAPAAAAVPEELKAKVRAQTAESAPAPRKASPGQANEAPEAVDDAEDDEDDEDEGTWRLHERSISRARAAIAPCADAALTRWPACARKDEDEDWDEEDEEGDDDDEEYDEYDDDEDDEDDEDEDYDDEDYDDDEKVSWVHLRAVLALLSASGADPTRPPGFCCTLRPAVRRLWAPDVVCPKRNHERSTRAAHSRPSLPLRSALTQLAVPRRRAQPSAGSTKNSSAEACACARARRTEA